MMKSWSNVASAKAAPAVKTAVDWKPVSDVASESELVKENRAMKAKIESLCAKNDELSRANRVLKHTNERLETLCSISLDLDPDVRETELNMACATKKLSNAMTNAKKENAVMEATHAAALAAMEATHAAALASMEASYTDKINALTRDHAIELKTVVCGHKAECKKREAEIASQIQLAEKVHRVEMQDLISAKKSASVLTDTNKKLFAQLKALKDERKEERKDAEAVLAYSNDAVKLKLFMDGLCLPADSDPVHNLMICLQFTHTVINGFKSHMRRKVASAAENRETVRLLYALIDISATVEAAVDAIRKQ